MKKLLSVLALALCVCLTVQAQRYDRGYANTTQKVFAPKGSFMIAGTGKVTWHREDNYNFLVIDGIDGDGYSVNISPTFLYMPWNNIGVGLRLGYDRMKLNVDKASLNVSEISMDIDDYFRLTQSFEAAAIFRPYIPLGNSGRFSLFAQVELGFNAGRVKNTARISQEVKGTYTGECGSAGLQLQLEQYGPQSDFLWQRKPCKRQLYAQPCDHKHFISILSVR